MYVSTCVTLINLHIKFDLRNHLTVSYVVNFNTHKTLINYLKSHGGSRKPHKRGIPKANIMSTDATTTEDAYNT